MLFCKSGAESGVNLGQNTVETCRILKEQMEETYQNYLHRADYCVNRESIFRAFVSLMSVSTWSMTAQVEINLGELFGIFMSLYHFWVRPDIPMNDDALNDYIGALFFSARELRKTGPDEKSVQLTGELVCGQDESILKIFHWGSWVLDMSAKNVFQCRLIEKGVKVTFNCASCGHQYNRDTSEIGRTMRCIECDQEITVPLFRHRLNTRPNA